MKILLAVLASFMLAACGSESGATGTDPADSSGDSTMPTSVPAADGPVRTRNLATVMDTGEPELCLGAVAESYPPQCGGLPMAGWAWKDYDGVFDREGDIRWGMFAVSGTFDGTTFTVTDAIPGALYDPVMTEEPSHPAPATDYPDAELEAISETLGTDLPGAQGAYVTDGHVLVDVTYDDGSLQEWADEEYGRDVVIVTSALVPVG